MAMRKAITIYVDEGCYIDAVCATWIVKREGSEGTGVTMQNFRMEGSNAIYVPIKCPADTPVRAWKEDITLPSAQPETGRWIDYTEDGYVECPFCHSATNCDDNVDDLHYCFSCGAKMEVEHEDD